MAKCVTKTDDKLIHDLARTKTIRELGRVLLSYLTVEEMAEFISTYIVLNSKDLDDIVISHYVRKNFFPLLKTGLLAMGDLLPDYISDREFRRLQKKLPKKFSLKKD